MSVGRDRIFEEMERTCAECGRDLDERETETGTGECFECRLLFCSNAEEERVILNDFIVGAEKDIEEIMKERGHYPKKFYRKLNIPK